MKQYIVTQIYRTIPKYLQKNKQVIRVLGFWALMTCIFISCRDNNQDLRHLPTNYDSIPTINDDSATMLISDSGIIRYKLVAKEWLMFEMASEPHWFFPEKFYVEQFDTAFNKQATIIADTAWYFTQKKLWRLKGNVNMSNINDETFNTEELFWDQNKERLYSDKYIEINQPGKLVLKGICVESNTQMTVYRIFRPFDSDIVFSEENDNSGVPTVTDENTETQTDE